MAVERMGSRKERRVRAEREGGGGGPALTRQGSEGEKGGGRRRGPVAVGFARAGEEKTAAPANRRWPALGKKAAHARGRAPHAAVPYCSARRSELRARRPCLSAAAMSTAARHEPRASPGRLRRWRVGAAAGGRG